MQTINWTPEELATYGGDIEAYIKAQLYEESWSTEDGYLLVATMRCNLETKETEIVFAPEYEAVRAKHFVDPQLAWDFVTCGPVGHGNEVCLTKLRVSQFSFHVDDFTGMLEEYFTDLCINDDDGSV